MNSFTLMLLLAAALPSEAGPLLGLLGLVIFIALIGVFAARVRQSFEDTLKALAEPAGLSYGRMVYQTNAGPQIGAGHQITGQLDGRDFSLTVAPDGRQGILSEKWIITLKRKFPEGFAAGKNGWRRSESPGCTFVRSGDASFDKKVFVETKEQFDLHTMLTPEVKAGLLSLAERNGLVYDGKVMFVKQGFDTRLPRLQERLAWLRDVAGKLEA